MKRRSNQGSNTMDSGEYSVGYGRPPLHTRYQKGKSGNERGRPRRRMNYATVVQQILGERISFRDGTRVRSVSKLEAMIHRQVFDALKGNTKSVTALVRLAMDLGHFEPELPPPPSLIFYAVDPPSHKG